MPEEFQGEMMAAKTSEHTDQKQQDFKSMVWLHSTIVEKTWASVKNADGRNWNPSWYTYLDLYAGPGLYKNDPYYNGFGSPMIVANVLRDKGIDYRIVFFNNDADECNSLVSYFNDDHQAHVFRGNNHDRIADLPPHKGLGLAYFDPNNIRFDLDLGYKVASRFPKIDLLFYFSAASDKRVRSKNGQSYGEGCTLIEQIKMLKKKRWLVKIPHSKFQYSFLLGTNGNIGEWRKVGWYSIDTPAGWEILEHLNYTKKEKDELCQPRLF